MYVHRRYMGTWILWTAGLALELLILLRFLTCRLYRHYPLFFGYMALVCTSSVILWPIYRVHPAAYANSFWALQFLTLLAGFGVMLELVQKSFQNYPGAKAFATAVLVMMFAILCGYFSHKLLATRPSSAGESFSDLERDFRVLQVIVLAGILVVISYYRIDIGRNLKGIVSGFGLYVGSTILSQAIRTFAGPSFDRGWETIQPYTYFVALLIWAVALWSYAPVPVPQSSLGLEHDYEALANGTKERLGAIRADVGRAEGK
jgi:hypothetical protein